MVVFTNVVNPNSQLCQSRNQFSSSDSQTSSSIDSTRTFVSPIIHKKLTDSVLCSQNTIQDDLNIISNDLIQSCETPIEQNYSISTISIPKHYAQFIGAMPVRS